ncbi:MAG: xanthine dehydrogenase family protein subunit M [Candidatus Binatus sp.]|jgi:xanthine dehydrogenase YagS FAD-binding subunit|uniref:FAD binding domain-containing protein n=1 Tax=Candidatus Binatus sp. TaxID=2811406 RepID=UPI003C96ED23
MNRFEVITPADLASASRLLAQDGHVAFAGGVDVVDLMKQGIVSPTALVNLKGLKELGGIEVRPSGELRLGATAKLSEVAEHPAIRARFTAIAEAASETATPQIRNLATVGGNLLQRPRCWYFRNPDVNCLKKSGDKCYAFGGLNRYHAILGGDPAFIVHPSNLAPALIAMRASATIVGPAGEHTIELEKFFTLPTVDPKRENSLKPGEIITEVIVPAPSASVSSHYLEAREKQSFDWPLVSVAIALDRAPGEKTIRDARVVMGAVAPVPWRSHEAEAALKGGPLDEPRARAAAKAALKGAQPMTDNAYKVVMAKVIVRRAIMSAAGLEAA